MDKPHVDPEEFRALREDLGFTQRDLSWRLDVTEATISRWENGARPIPLVAWKALLYEQLAQAAARGRPKKGA